MVQEEMEKDVRRTKCYAAAMSRQWGIGPEHFDKGQRPRRVDVGGRKYTIKPASENDGVKTLLEMALEALDIAYEKVGDGLSAEEPWDSACDARTPSAYEQNGMLCRVVMPIPVAKRMRVC